VLTCGFTNGLAALAAQRVHLGEKHKTGKHGQQMGQFRFARKPRQPRAAACRRKSASRRDATLAAIVATSPATRAITQCDSRSRLVGEHRYGFGLGRCHAVAILIVHFHPI
jgi:hypothetical protein